MSTTRPSVAELARRCSESSHQLYEEMGLDLDRRVGAALAAVQARRSAQSQPPVQLSNCADGMNTPEGRAASPESRTKSDSFVRQP